MTDQPHGTPPDPGDPMARPRGRSSGQCTATSKSTGERCRHLAMIGTTVCRHHGGASPQVQAAIVRRNAEAEAERIAARFDLSDAPPLTDPIGQLARVAGQTVYLLDRIAEATIGDTPDPDAPAFTALERALDRASRLLVEVNRLGLAEQQLALSNAQAEQLVAVVRGIVADLGHDLDDPGTKQVVVARMRQAAAIEAGTA